MIRQPHYFDALSERAAEQLTRDVVRELTHTGYEPGPIQLVLEDPTVREAIADAACERPASEEDDPSGAVTDLALERAYELLDGGGHGQSLAC